MVADPLQLQILQPCIYITSVNILKNIIKKYDQVLLSFYDDFFS